MDISEKLQRSLITVKLMFEARNYKNISKPIKKKSNKINIIELCADYKNQRDGTTEKIKCIWIPFNSRKLTSTIGKQDIQKYCSSASKSDHFIFITDSISFQAVNFLIAFSCYYEVLSYTDMACIKNNHCYVPNYTLLSENEVKLIEIKFGPRTGFNKMIFKIDAVARFMDFREGDVILIDKFSCIGGTSKSYRYVINENSIM